MLIDVPCFTFIITEIEEDYGTRWYDTSIDQAHVGFDVSQNNSAFPSYPSSVSMSNYTTGTIPTSRRRSSLVESFKMIDSDGSGTISASELKAYLNALGQSTSNDDVQRLLEAEGVDFSGGDCSIDCETFLGMMASSNVEEKPLTKDVLLEIFRTIDLDASEYITPAEMQHFLSNIGMILDGDDDVSQLMRMDDENGDGRITFDEFVNVVEGLGFPVDRDSFIVLDDETAAVKEVDPLEEEKKEEEPSCDSSPKLIALSSIENLDLRKALAAFDVNDDGFIDLENVLDAAEGRAPAKLHWSEKRPTGGLSAHVKSVNHIAVLVSDVATSTKFYRDVIGLEQIRRPNFDSHGAWFTMGNCELHLIKGKPVVHKGDDLVVGHISLDADDIAGVLPKLKAMKVPFRKNTSVPAGKDAGTMNTNANNDMMSSKIVTQFFIRDPDGYYLEICNCDETLTEYCLGKKEDLAGYEDGVKPLSLSTAVTTLSIMNAWVAKLNEQKVGMKELYSKVKSTDGSIAEVSALLKCTRAARVDETLLQTIIDRRSIYGDVCQNEEEEDIEEIVLASGNSAVMTEYIIKLREKFRGKTIFRPPAVFNSDGTKYMPPVIIRENVD